MKYDYAKLYTKNREFLEKHARVKGGILLVNATLPCLFALAYLSFLAYALFGNGVSVKALSKAIYLPAIALTLVSVLQVAIYRPRPYQSEGAGITPLKGRSSRNNSMPSRHMASGGVLAICLLPHALPVGIFLLACCAALGYCRFAVGWHYPSDLWVGFALGALVGCATFVL